MPPDPDSVWRQIGQYTGLALMLPAAGLIGYAIGFELDARLHTGHICTVIFLLLGAVAGLIEIVRVAGKSDSPSKPSSTK